MQVKVVCTTDDPVDDLQYHKKIKDDNFSIKVLPAFRPDKAMSVQDAIAFNDYVNQLGNVSDTDITSFKAFLDALKKRHDYFNEMGCRISDHGLEKIYADDFTSEEIKIFSLN